MAVCGLMAPPCQSSRTGWSLTAAAAQTRGLNFTPPAAPPTTVAAKQPRWRREGGFLIADIILDNRAEFPVHNVILACDFFDEGGLPLGKRRSLVLQPLSPGANWIEGIEFTMLKDNGLDADMRGGPCGVTSAEHLWIAGPSANR
jgi:hypothetical protein